MPGFNRVTIIERLYHQTEEEDEKISEIDVAYEQYLSSSDQMYKQTIVVTTTPTALETGWLKNYSRIHLENRFGKGEASLLNSDEKHLKSLHVVKVFEEGSKLYWIIPPGGSFHGHHSDPTKLRLQAGHGKIKVRVSIFPQ